MAQRKGKPQTTQETTTTTTDAIEQELQGTVSNTGDTVVVCLNRPVGIKYKLRDGREIVIPGNSAHLRGKEMGELNIGGGFSLTVVKRTDWEEIEATYKDTALFKQGRIFAAANHTEALAQAKDKKSTRHGLEPTKGVKTKPVKEDEK